MMAQTYIYTLSDPITGEIKYVGRTTDLEKRNKMHLAQAKKTGLRDWIRSLLDKKQKPIMRWLETVESEQAAEREFYWINKLEASGCQLYNMRKNRRGWQRNLEVSQVERDWEELSKILQEAIERSENMIPGFPYPGRQHDIVRGLHIEWITGGILTHGSLARILLTYERIVTDEWLEVIARTYPGQWKLMRLEVGPEDQRLILVPINRPEPREIKRP